MDAKRHDTTSLHFVHPAELHAYWPYVRPRLEIVARRARARWIAEDVYTALKNGAATLHIAEAGDEYLGLLVLRPTTDFDGPALQVWAVYCESKGVIEALENEVAGYARKIGARRLTFTSPRAWGRRLSKLGYVATSQVFEKEV